jgi:hypothetical protein
MKYIHVSDDRTDTIPMVRKRDVEGCIIMLVSNGGIIEIAVTMITLRYTSFRNLIAGSCAMLLRKYRRASRQIWDMTIAATRVDSGGMPRYSNRYEIGKFSKRINPTTSW